MRTLLLMMIWLSSSHANQLCDGFLPENDLWIGVNERNAGTVTENQFNQVLDKIEAIYSPVMNSKGQQLVVERRWSDGTVNAYANASGDITYITMFGGLARHPEATMDGFALVACHEIGHHLGGAPLKWENYWPSSEGQSDYYATAKCFHRYALSDDNISIVAGMDIPDTVTSSCQDIYTSAQEVAICQRGSMAGLSLGRVLAETGGESFPEFDLPSVKQVSSTITYHPKAQCRLDTYFQGALCDKDYLADFDLVDASVNACSRTEGYAVGTRPLCWFKP